MKVSIPNTSAEQSVNAIQFDSDASAASLENWVTIQNVGGNVVYILRQASGTPTCQTVIDTGSPIAATTGVLTIYDTSATLAPNQLFLAATVGASEIRAFT